MTLPLSIHRASGPLFKVDHWLGAFPGFRPVFGEFLGASGPLFKVDHWLDTFPGFRPVFGEFLGASGPLDKVDHWLIGKVGILGYTKSPLSISY